MKAFKNFLQVFLKKQTGKIVLFFLIPFFLLTLFAELIANNRPIFLKIDNKYFFPTYSKMIFGKDIGLSYEYEVNYKDLQNLIANKLINATIVMPPIPYNPIENDFTQMAPAKPNFLSKHYLGTDSAGRDVLARIIYGMRTTVIFSLFVVTINYIIGIIIGSFMGIYGGFIDLIGQRCLEIWANVPFIYVVLIIFQITSSGWIGLFIIMISFGWMSIAWQMRTFSYREKEKGYIKAIKAFGGSTTRIIFKHLLPNAIPIIVSRIPFSFANIIATLTALDFLGLGLPPPAPSLGELLRQGINSHQAIWIMLPVIILLVTILVIINLIGESIQNITNPKQRNLYE